MRPRFKERFWWTAAVLLMTVVLITLGVLQYRWSGGVSQAATLRMQAGLQSSIWGFRQELHRDLAALCPPVKAAPGQSDLAGQLADWQPTVERSELIAGVYRWQGDGKQPTLQRFDPQLRRFVDADWPADLLPLSQWLDDASTHMAMMMQPASGPSRPHAARPHFIMRMAAPPCMVDENIPALVRPVALAPEAAPAHPGHEWIVIALDPRAISARLLPELAGRYFGSGQGLDFDVAVLGGQDGHQLLYASDPAFNPHVAAADAQAPLFGPFPPPDGKGIFVTSTPPPHRAPSPPAAMKDAPGLVYFRAGDQNLDAGEWTLVVRHRNGSLEQTVARARERDLALSFGILLILAVTMGLILRVTHRSQRLARLQMDFVTGVSHELRTPLSVIASAADNLADGIVANTSQVSRYGQAIKEQAEQLKGLVEQILLFAATRDGQYRYNLRPVSTQAIVETALAHTAELVHNAGVKVESSVAPALPPVMADLSAISQCLQNLIINAVKYGGEKRWVGITATAADGRHGREVRIAVADKGIGIRGRDLERIFEPFYRGDDALGAQIHGTGLGLTLARSIAEAMGGAITVRSADGHGTVFTLHLPATDAAAESPVTPAGVAR